MNLDLSRPPCNNMDILSLSINCVMGGGGGGGGGDIATGTLLRSPLSD